AAGRERAAAAVWEAAALEDASVVSDPPEELFGQPGLADACVRKHGHRPRRRLSDSLGVSRFQSVELLIAADEDVVVRTLRLADLLHRHELIRRHAVCLSF